MLETKPVCSFFFLIAGSIIDDFCRAPGRTGLGTRPGTRREQTGKRHAAEHAGDGPGARFGLMGKRCYRNGATSAREINFCNILKHLLHTNHVDQPIVATVRDNIPPAPPVLSAEP